MVRHDAAGHEAAASAAKVLANVPRLSWKNGECTFAGSVVACMQFLGHPVSYDYVMGVSGGAFKLLWHRKWCPSNNSMGVLGWEVIRRTFRALGYGYEITVKQEGKDCEDEFRRKIVGSIDAGRPVIAWGIVGPPDEGVVAGYQRGGEVLVGRSYFGNGHAGYYQKSDWCKDCHGLILIGDRTEVPAKEKVLGHALEWALQLAFTPVSEELPTADPGRITGLAAYDAWASALQQDANFPANDLQTLTSRCLVNRNVTLSGLRDARRAAAAFVRNQARDEAAYAPCLVEAAEAYDEEVRILDYAMSEAPSTFDSESRQLRMADPDLRGRMAEALRAAKVKDRVAVQALELALAELK
jgi:hypothetical protein